jgi:hypothetical protein
VQAVGPPTIGEISRLKPAYFSIYLHIKRKTPENRAYFISIITIKETMSKYPGSKLKIEHGNAGEFGKYYTGSAKAKQNHHKAKMMAKRSN